MDSSIYSTIKAKHIEFAVQRGTEKTYCPSEVARTLFPENWRDKMDEVRAVADELWKKGKLEVLQFDKILNLSPSEVKGHIRLRRGPSFN